ncbi:hypothetical protein IWX90DRAFT_419228 [Phyllosticta citrichinensis]|uniref:Uncharacterized protein n=1 Tax=Phyllosticta citrichinensis TaxID=1130410 RepID=A0ABR1XFD5_9PEZI
MADHDNLRKRLDNAETDYELTTSELEEKVEQVKQLEDKNEHLKDKNNELEMMILDLETQLIGLPEMVKEQKEDLKVMENKVEDMINCLNRADIAASRLPVPSASKSPSKQSLAQADEGAEVA